MRQDALKIDNMLESWTRLTQISRLCAVVCLKFNQPEPFSKFSPFPVDSLLSGDCHAMSRRCSWNQPSVKRRFESFFKYYDTSVQKLVFLLYLTPKNKRQEINLEGFSVCVFRRLILGFKYMFTRRRPRVASDFIIGQFSEMTSFWRIAKRALPFSYARAARYSFIYVVNFRYLL